MHYRSQCIEGVSFICNGTQDNNCNDGQATERQWQIAFYNFDNMASSLLSVVEVAVMDNFMDDVAYFVMDATGKLSSLKGTISSAAISAAFLPKLIA